MITLNFIPKKFEAFLLIYKDGKNNTIKTKILRENTQR